VGHAASLQTEWLTAISGQLNVEHTAERRFYLWLHFSNLRLAQKVCQHVFQALAGRVFFALSLDNPQLQVLQPVVIANAVLVVNVLSPG
jgi:hypothetical protein